MEYSENFEGWSDDLTQLHEEAAGDQHPIDVASRNHALTQIETHMPKSGAVIMDIGCSSGFLLKDLRNRSGQNFLIGADVVKAPLLKLAGELKSIPLIRFDLLQCPLPARSVDAIVMLNVFEHIGDDELAMQKAFELLAPGGVLVVEVPAGPSLFGPYDVQLNHFRRYTSAELESKLKAAGFGIVSKSHLGFIIFPAFALVKLKDKFFAARAKPQVVAEQASSTKNSWLMSKLMRIETKYLSRRSLPFGIRVTMTAMKPV
ncbi:MULTISPECIES: methyltransferase domain-containing protein [unclassified Rhizobium]|uniref:class I SAM-dependent DNA methyltransferase n=1 Tax=unclassified Rhizobium TaxID=2613769 RepID=UPI0011608EE8|nr:MULTISPECIES: methyltransferase domain-containing protein [unclassified Rhizobium]TQX86923.1 class I SAM-dependent methyltransferase [Rhizobium sp. rho-13.1]TQY05591.1 class I SAM-dependent methyltransferase [Rhizobium sp. rho-1.1]